MDENVGRVLENLDRLGLGDDTLVIFLADHGDLMFDHGCIEKTFLYEHAIRIPLIIAGPGLPRGAKRPQLVSQIDLLPTVLDLCGIEQDCVPLDGRGMVPIPNDAASDWREILFCEVEQSVHLQGFVTSFTAKMLRTGPWEYIYTLVDGHIVVDELYNLEVDPHELYNLSHDRDQVERIAGFRLQVLRWLVPTEATRLRPASQNHYPVPKVDKRFL